MLLHGAIYVERVKVKRAVYDDRPDIFSIDFEAPGGTYATLHLPSTKEGQKRLLSALQGALETLWADSDTGLIEIWRNEE